MVPLSILDLAPVVEGGDVGQALRRSLDLARHAERLGYHRYWLAEHHGMPGIASAATAVAMAHVAQGTSRIRVGAGGIMLPNHAPLVIAEQFGTLEALFPGRIDLGVGRAPGTDGRTAYALRRSLQSDEGEFPQDVQELLAYLGPPQPGQVLAVPGAGSNVPVYVLGSSLFGAQLAAALGLPYAFASHFAPAALEPALALYRAQYRPSERWPQPYVMAGFNVIAAETDEEARFLQTSLEQAVVRLRTGRPGKLPPPARDLRWDPLERQLIDSFFTCAAVGSPATVRQGLEAFVARTRVDEVIVAGQVFDHDARVRSFELLARAVGQAGGA
jgi:luciferase family oxidoreductase group 1